MTDKMPRTIYIEENGKTIHGERVMPEFSAHKYSKNPLNGKLHTQYTNTEALIAELEGMKKTFWFPDDREDTLRSDYWNAAIDAVIEKVRGDE